MTPITWSRFSIFLALISSLATSGQPTEKQFALIARAGFSLVINLAPHDGENALEDEESLVRELGMEEEKARQDLETIWSPFGVWKEFIDGKAA